MNNSSSSCCLFCFGDCSQTAVAPFANEEIPGAVRSSATLNHQLQNVFILRNILDIDPGGCAEVLRRIAETREDVSPTATTFVNLDPSSISIPKDDGNQNLEFWFRMCPGCWRKVKEVWRLYQKLLDIQGKMNEIKGDLKKVMEDGMRLNVKCEDGGSSLEDVIRKMVFSEQGLIPESFHGAVKDEPLQDSDSSPNDDDVNVDFPVSEVEEVEVRVELSELTTCSSSPYRLKRKRGRPPKSVQFANSLKRRFVPRRHADRKTKTGLNRHSARGKDEDNVKSPLSPSLQEDLNHVSDTERDFSSSPIGIDLPQKFKRKRGRPPKNASSFISRRIRKPLWSCPHCSIRYRDHNPEKIRLHLERHKRNKEKGGGEFDCPQCGFPAKDKFELDVHIRYRHINPPRHREYKCRKDGCEFKTRTGKALLEHAKESHPELGLTKADLKKREEGTFLCSQCTRVFPTARSLNAHQRASHPQLFGVEEEEVQCNQCDRKFTAKIYLQDHINNVHTDDNECPRPFMCDLCGRKYPTSAQLKVHKISHSKKREHVCQICGADYNHKHNLTNHMKLKHGNNNEEGGVSNQEVIKCRFCAFETPFRPALIRHMESHKKEMGFQCDICSRCYTNAQGLRRHQRINHSDTQVACPYCNRKFPCDEYMKDHMKRSCKMRELKEQQQQEKAQT